jgi:hypothetical protein
VVNLIVQEARAVCAFDRFTQGVEVIQGGDKGLQRRKIICEGLSTRFVLRDEGGAKGAPYI